jgi:hypothetical protein
MLFEAPLPPDFDSDTILPSKEYYGKLYDKSVADIRDRLDTEANKKKFGVEMLGKIGSSRVTYRLDVPASAFSDKSVLRKFKIDLKGKVPTAIKIAINAKGIAQNRAEIDAFKSRPSYLFVPLLDTSYENKKRTIEINGQVLPPEESSWIQMLAVNNYDSDDVWREDLERFFGFPSDSRIGVGWLGFLPELKNALKNGYYQFYYHERYEYGMMFASESPQPLLTGEKYPLSGKQRKNLEEFLELEKIGLRLRDMESKVNWGHLGNRPYILDYGLNKSTGGLYDGSEHGVAAIDNRGVVSLTIKRSAREMNQMIKKLNL